MTTIVTTASNGPLAANGSNPIPFTFQAISEEEIEVTREGLGVSPLAYTVTLNDDGTGSITPVDDWGTDEVYITSYPTYQQPTEFSKHGAFYPDRVNPALDRLARTILHLKQRTESISGGDDALLRADLLATSGSERVNYMAGLAGAGSRPVNNKLDDYPSLFDFMTSAQIADVRAGTGLEDVTAAITAAMATGKVFKAPAGTYKITGEIPCHASYAGIIGDGYRTLFLTNHATANIFEVGDGVNPINGLLFRDFRVWSSVTKTAGYVFSTYYATNCSWYNIGCGTIDSYGGSGSTHKLFKGYKFERFLECLVDGGQVVTSSDCVTAFVGAELTIGGGMRFYGSTGKAIYLAGDAGGVHLKRGDVSLCAYGVYCDTLLGATQNRELFWQGDFSVDTCTNWGFNIEANGLALLEFNNGWIAGCGQPTGAGGIRIAPSVPIKARWTGARIYGNYGDGIQISDGYHTFVGGMCHFNGRDAGGGYGILIGSASGLIVQGMIIRDNGTAAKGYGIWLSGGVDNFAITGNVLQGNAQGPLLINGDPGPSLTKVIRDNVGYVTENSGPVVLLSGTSSLVVNHGLNAAPTVVSVTFGGAQDAGAQPYVDPASITATQFTISYGMSATANRTLVFRATRGA